jgi:hypothetical protein
MAVSVNAQQTESYSTLWGRVEMAVKKDLPKTVVAEAQLIYNKAEREKNVPQMIKAYLTSMLYQSYISFDSKKENIAKLKQWAEEETSVAYKASLYSILGTDLLEVYGENLKEGVESIRLSLADAEALMDISAQVMRPVAIQGKSSSQYFEDNLYELLARRAIAILKGNCWVARHSYNQTLSFPEEMNTVEGLMNASLPAVSDYDLAADLVHVYQTLLKRYHQKGNREALLLTALDAYKDMEDLSLVKDGKYQQRLRSLMQEFADVEVCAEVYICLLESASAEMKLDERLALVHKALKDYPDYPRINVLKNMEAQLRMPTLIVEFASVYPGDSIPFEVRHRNIHRVQLNVYQLDMSADSIALEKIKEKNVHEYGRLLMQKDYELKSDIEVLTTNLALPPLPVGIYYVLAQDVDGKMRQKQVGSLLYVSSLYAMERPLGNERVQMSVVDRKTGHPVSQAELTLYNRNLDRLRSFASYQADERGLLDFGIKGLGKLAWHVHTPADKAMEVEEDWMNSWIGRKAQVKPMEVRLFVDRAIYRPGQKLQVSGLVCERDGDRMKTRKGVSCILTLLDPNGKDLAELEVKSDAFGVFSGEFVIPQGRMNGNYNIEAEIDDVFYESVGFQVEEYKRPTFEVTFEPFMDEYKAGDEVTLTGWAKTYAGVPVQNAIVNYTNVLKQSRWWRWGEEINRESGQAVTDSDGRFEIKIRLLKMNTEGHWYYDCVVNAEVTNPAGETQSGNTTLPLGSSSVIINLEGWENENIQKESGKTLRFNVMNLTGEQVDVPVDYRVYRCNEEGERKEQMLEGTMKANQEQHPDAFNKLPSGKYQLVAETLDSQGRKAEVETNFVLFSAKDKHVPYQTPLWYYQDGKAFQEGKPVTLWVGTSEQDVYLYYDVFTDGKHLESKSMLLNDTLQAFQFTYRPEYGDGINVSVGFVKNFKLYKHEFKIEKPKPDKKLVLKWKTFRDKLRPGSQETWTLNVARSDGTPVSANLLATMYDASLDAFIRHEWALGYYYPRFIPDISWEAGRFINPYLPFFYESKSRKYPHWDYSRFWSPDMLERSKILQIVEYNSDVDVVFEEEIIPMNKNAVVKGYAASPRMQSDVPATPQKSKVRSNFAETAFFYPNLRTASNGEVNFSFTLPESLTRWKFMGLAHTMQMEYGYMEDEVVASKDFMLQPQLPRFARIGDQVTLSATVMNLTDKNVKGKVCMELFNPETDKVWMKLQEKFEAQAKGSEVVHFNLEVADKYQVLAVRMVAEGNGFSDGEQRYLPVLSNKQWLTETLPLYVNANEKRVFSIDDLFNKHSQTATKHRLTVEMTGNPMWYAVQALPAVSNPTSEDALSWAVAHYANGLASYVAQSNPRIRQVVESWQAHGGGKEAFISQLQKNEDLKNLLLEETPWITEATDEAEQRRRMAVLFDVNQMTHRLEESASRLESLQTADGSWSWFAGMHGSRFVTTQIVEMLARLQFLAGTQQEIAPMYRRGMDYLKNQVAKEVKDMKEAEKKGAKRLLPSEDALRYLYICSLDSDANPDKSTVDYLIKSLEKMPLDLTVYGKAKCALVLHRFGKEQVAKEFMQSLMEYSLVNDEMGRYFDSSKAYYSWFSYRIPTQVAAIEAVNLLEGDERKMNELKRWLLKQKQTQAWDTPISTADAVYALLATGADMLSAGNEVSVTLDNVVIRTPDDALGYVKWTADDKVTQVRQALVENRGESIAWGAVYAQCLEDMDKVTAQGNALKIARTLYKEGKALAKGAALQVGDKLTVRLTVVADRDMDFVQVKDERAACFEPVDVLSGYRWNGQIGYYQETKDASTSFYLDRMRKGAYELTYDVYVTSSGVYQQGIATARSVYAPEFGGHSSSSALVIQGTAL